MPLDEFAAAVAATDLLVTVDTMAALRRRAGTSGMADAAFVAALVLGHRARSNPVVPNGAAVPPGRSAGLVTLAAMPRAITAVVKATVMVKSTSDPAPTHLRADFLPRT